MYHSSFRTADHCQIKAFNRSLSGSVDRLFCGMDKQMHTGMIFVDLQKVFDTLDHGVLLEKMKYFGFRASVIKWF